MDKRLSADERKIFRILMNVARLKRKPSIEDMSRWSGRNRQAIHTALAGLAEKRYIRCSLGQINLLKKDEGLDFTELLQERLPK